MNNLTIAGIDTHVTRIADNIAGLRILQAVYGCAHTSVRRRRMRQAHTKVFVNAHHETRAVRTIGQAGAAVHIRITHKLDRKSVV